MSVDTFAPRAARFAAALALVAAAGVVPASAANREHQQMLAEVRQLQEQNAQLQQTMSTLIDTLKAVNTKLLDLGLERRGGIGGDGHRGRRVARAVCGRGLGQRALQRRGREHRESSGA